MGLVTLTFDLLTLKLVCESHAEFGHVRHLGSRVIRYVRNRRTDKSNAYCPLPYRGRHNKDGLVFNVSRRHILVILQTILISLFTSINGSKKTNNIKE